MISEEEARNKILEAIQPLPSRKIALADALDRFSARDYFGTVPLPGFNNSAMDGFAVRATDCAPGKKLRVIGEQPAGLDRNLRISSMETVRLFTGAPIPDGADAVVMQEDVARDGDFITLNTEVARDDFIRRRGCDLAAGQKLIGKGERIGATVLALLASQGLADVEVGGEVTGAVITTGDEIVPMGAKIGPGQIFDSNGALLRAMLQRTGASVQSVEHCGDEAEPLREAIARGARAHVLVISGGVSVGEHDLVKEALHSLGGEIDLWRVAIKPGKPFLFERLGNCAVFGLPGNPVSSFVTFLRFVRPAILRLMGAADLALPEIPVRLGADIKSDGDRVHYMRGKIENGNFIAIGRQESHALFGLSRANALLRVEPGADLKANSMVDIMLWE